MGYTHYWQGGNVDAIVWAKIVADVKKIIEHSDVPLVFEHDDPGSIPMVDEKAIRFNGAGDDGHETFIITPNATEFEFCKTANKPYDKIVCAVLAIVKDHEGDAIRVTSDGDKADWADGITFASTTLGRPIACPLPEKEIAY